MFGEKAVNRKAYDVDEDYKEIALPQLRNKGWMHQADQSRYEVAGDEHGTCNPDKPGKRGKPTYIVEVSNMFCHILQ